MNRDGKAHKPDRQRESFKWKKTVSSDSSNHGDVFRVFRPKVASLAGHWWSELCAWPREITRERPCQSRFHKNVLNLSPILRHFLLLGDSCWAGVSRWRRGVRKARPPQASSCEHSRLNPQPFLMRILGLLVLRFRRMGLLGMLRLLPRDSSDGCRWSPECGIHVLQAAPRYSFSKVCDRTGNLVTGTVLFPCFEASMATSSPRCGSKTKDKSRTVEFWLRVIRIFKKSGECFWQWMKYSILPAQTPNRMENIMFFVSYLIWKMHQRHLIS